MNLFFVIFQPDIKMFRNCLILVQLLPDLDSINMYVKSQPTAVNCSC